MPCRFGSAYENNCTPLQLINPAHGAGLEEQLFELYQALELHMQIVGSAGPSVSELMGGWPGGL